MLNFTYSWQAEFYTVSTITRPCSMGLFVNICINKDLLDNYNPSVGDKCIRLLQWALGVHQRIQESEGSKSIIVSGSTQEFLFSLS